MMRFIFAIAAIATTSQSTISPGLWEANSQLVDVEVGAGMPPGAEDMIRSAFGSEGITTQTCVTQEQIDRGPEELFSQTDGDCAYEDFAMENGRVMMAARCDGPAGPMTMSMEGTYSATTYSTTMRMAGDGGMGPMTMVFAIEGRRVGDCDG